MPKAKKSDNGGLRATCAQADLAKGLVIVARAVAARSTLPILGNILIGNDPMSLDRLGLQATNLEVGITCSLHAHIATEGAITVPARTIVDLVNAMPDDEQVTLEVNERTQTQTISAGRYHNGGAGGQYFVQMINLLTTVFDRDGNVIELPFPSNAIWKDFGGNCEAYNQGDPIVLYDEQADRWLFSQFAFPDNLGSFSQCVAISQTDDPRAGYNRYEFSFNGIGFNDYPKHGIVSDSITLMANLFTKRGAQFWFGGNWLAVLNKAAMYAGTTATMRGFNIGTGQFGFVAGDLDGPGSAEALFGTAMSTASTFDIWRITPNWGGSSASINTAGSSLRACTPDSTATRAIPPGSASRSSGPTAIRAIGRAMRTRASWAMTAPAATASRGGARASHSTTTSPAIRWWACTSPCPATRATRRRPSRARPVTAVAVTSATTATRATLARTARAVTRRTAGLWEFDHAKTTSFALVGAHARATCDGCHREPPDVVKLSSDCASCYARDDVHLGQYGRQCQRCHGKTTFKGARLQ